MRDSLLNAGGILQMMSAILVSLLGIGLLAVMVMYVVDKTQTKSAIRRNFPVVGRFRYFFENLGEYFRQYFFAQDREEMPFNRAQRSWVYRAAKTSITRSHSDQLEISDLSAPSFSSIVPSPFSTPTSRKPRH